MTTKPRSKFSLPDATTLLLVAAVGGGVGLGANMISRLPASTAAASASTAASGATAVAPAIADPASTQSATPSYTAPAPRIIRRIRFIGQSPQAPLGQTRTS